MKAGKTSFALITLSLLAMSSATRGAAATQGALSFEKDIRPILKTHCFHCHGEDGVTEGDLDVRLTRFLIKGGESGAAIKPGDAGHSHLLQRIQKGEMPKGKARLSQADITTIERWISEGAKTLRPEPEKLGPEHAFTDEERAWWSFQPISRPAIPATKTPRNPIDAFIQKALAEKGLTPSPQADPITLVRRFTLDLTGLPPTPEETSAFEKAFVADATAATSALVDRLLASPEYGERWGRHWLDVAGYADSDGFDDKDLERKWAYKYRDYVIQSLNDDLPFDEFVREQLAGDEIAAAEGLNADAPTADQRQRYAKLLTATGFLRMAPDGTGASNVIATRNACITDTIKVVSTALYGMTVACAQCHDHRYDPISQEDYYRFRAIFEPGFDMKNWRTPAGRLISLQTKAEREGIVAQIEAEAKKIDAARLVKQEAFIADVLDKELAKRDAAIRDDLRAAYRTEPAKRTPAQKKLLATNPSVEKLSAGSLYLYDTTYKTKYADELKKMTADAAALRAKKPTEEFVQAFTEKPAAKPELIPATFVFNRGEPDQPKQQVKPGDLSVLAASRAIEIPEKAPALPTSGRRLAFAKSITDGRHPLLARVLVNRIWMNHFGKGIVTSVGDFGALGQKPTNPELMDWLASEFMRQGWSMKRLHRLILTSATYQQSSARRNEAELIDPDNQLLSRMNVRRLEAEAMRDSLLSVCGKLNTKHAGQSVPVMFTEEGQVVLGADTTDTAGRQTGKYIPLNGEEFRRSIYVQIRRTRPLEIFAAFDAPAMTEPNCEARPVTTVSPQSLLLMNNNYLREYAGYFAHRVQAEASDLTAQIHRAWNLAYTRPMSMADEQAALEFIAAQTAYYEKHPAPLEVAAGPAAKENASAPLLALAAYCHALISSNAFIYVD